MLYHLGEEMFSELFGVKPISICDYTNLLQVKFSFNNIDHSEFYEGLRKLKLRYMKTEYLVRVLFVYPNTMQIIVGTHEEVRRLRLESSESDFVMPIC